MESLLNLMSQSAPVLASLLTGIWFLSNKFNVVEKKIIKNINNSFFIVL